MKSDHQRYRKKTNGGVYLMETKDQSTVTLVRVEHGKGDWPFPTRLHISVAEFRREYEETK